jgi:hypothetical protein
VWDPGKEWSPGGVVSENQHLGARRLESQVVDIAGGDSPRGKSPTMEALTVDYRNSGIGV